MNLFKNGVGRPSNETIKKRNIFKGVCVVFGLIIILLVGYILNDKGIINLNNKKTSDNNTDITTTTKKELKEEILSDEEGKKIVESVFGNFTMFYAIDSKKLELNDNNTKTFAAIINVKEGTKKYTCKQLFGNDIKDFSDSYGEGYWQVEGLLCRDEYQTLFSYSDVNKKYKEMFGNEVNASKATINTISGGAYGYSKSEEGYSFLSCQCGEGHAPMISGFKNVIQKGNVITIEYAQVMADNNEYFIFNDGTKLKYDYTKEDEYNFEKYKEKIDSMYTMVFELQDDGSYIFKEVK